MSLTDERARQAALNNALWCDAVCRAHGRPGEFLDDVWINGHQTPQFYPNAVTLSGAGQATAQLARVRSLVDAKLLGELGVKDSFAALDLSPLHFRVLIEARWIYRDLRLPRPAVDLAGVRWARVETAADLGDWESAWSGGGVGDHPGERERIFLPALLTDKDIAVIAAYEAERIVAGAIANRAAGVVGLSNVFVPAQGAARFWAGCVARVSEAFPDLPLVGYEQGPELRLAASLGFEPLAPLRVWVRGQSP